MFSLRRTHLAIPCSLAIIALAACSDGTGIGGSRRIQAHLQRVGGSSGVSGSRNVVNVAADLSTPNNPVISATGATWTSNVAITSLKAPIFTIRLASDSYSVPLYQCSAATNDGCLVELNGTALQDLISAQPVSAPVGTYNQVVVETCKASGGYTSYITGSATIGGTTYYTTTSGVMSQSGPAQPTPLAYSGCARRYTLPAPVVVSDTAASTIPFTLFFDIRDIAWIGVNGVSSAWIPSGCSPRDANGQVPSSFVCVGYPDVAGIAGTSAPVLERYRVNGGATIGIFFTADTDRPIGGFTRRYFAEGVTADPGFSADTPIDSLSKNADGSLYITTFGGSVQGSNAIGPSYFAARAFKRADHSGAFTSQGQAGTYAAVKLP